MNTYQHRPQASGLHAKLLRELSASSEHTIRPRYGAPPNHIVVCQDERKVRNSTQATSILWQGHRDLMPSVYRGAQDPYGLLSRPASD